MQADARSAPTSRRVEGTYYALTLGSTLAASFIWGINTLFLLDAGLTNLEAFAANAFFTAGMVLFEIPTGVVADTWGRRASYLLGYAPTPMRYDGKFHEIEVKVKRGGVQIRARNGYFAPSVAEMTAASRAAEEAVLPTPVETAFKELVRSARPDEEDQPGEVRTILVPDEPSAELSVRDGSILRNGASTGQDYWTLAGAVDLTVKASGTGTRKRVADFKAVGASSARVDLPDKIFGGAAFIHDMRFEGMLHARVVRQPNRGATIGAIDEKYC